MVSISSIFFALEAKKLIAFNSLKNQHISVNLRPEEQVGRGFLRNFFGGSVRVKRDFGCPLFTK